ncbi:ring-1,2-phenylacetyl-CoA epoxidase subunit PaaE [Chitinophaga niastensis]|uniref:Ring-1,2-phenylacetyl-CoA epoxidase subunit PaaE n=1 Tax=Chitinophaga niastensis TaxID=536980 RepID=A0A2P8HGK6_CHINA|nr:ferredoxin--NADP reductase [Chitinophaga niastensis]PSL45348.1 ring-1,2-phenylacetyl-CoA epoxidase subunit PaaE [Chitinophaga niastensis]
MSNTHIWKTAGIIRETPETITIIFDTGGVPFIYKPGQFIQLTLSIEGVPVTRSYSLSSSPDEAENPAITVKKVAGGIMSNFIVNEVAHIRQWKVEGPYGSFTPAADIFEKTKHVVLLAGGSGITPLFSIARSIISRSADMQVTIIYASRSHEEIIFRQSIADWQQRHSDRLNIHHALSAPDNTTSGTFINGRLNKLITRKLIKQGMTAPHQDAHYFLCGPVGLMKMHQEMLEAWQVPAGNVFMEWFLPEKTETPDALSLQAQEVLLHFYEQSNLLEVPAGKSILAAALEDRISLPYSCKAGTCGICAAKLTAGKVNMLQNYALQKTDLDEGMILLCQSYPLSNDVTVEIG